jgi:hypothetical protein
VGVDECTLLCGRQQLPGADAKSNLVTCAFASPELAPEVPGVYVMIQSMPSLRREGFSNWRLQDRFSRLIYIICTLEYLTMMSVVTEKTNR